MALDSTFCLKKQNKSKAGSKATLMTQQEQQLSSRIIWLPQTENPITVKAIENKWFDVP
jgi:hypothetical protein